MQRDCDEGLIANERPVCRECRAIVSRHAVPNEVTRAYRNPASVLSHTQTPHPSDRISTAVGAMTSPEASIICIRSAHETASKLLGVLTLSDTGFAPHYAALRVSSRYGAR